MILKEILLFLRWKLLLFMTTDQNTQDIELDNPADIELNKPSKSRFLFLLGFFGFFIFAWAGCYNLHEHAFQKNDNIVVPGSTLYEPTYK